MRVAFKKQGNVIAIDGPAGTGKSSVTRRLASKLNYIHIDTGALYRSVAFLLLEQGRQSDLENQSTQIARSGHFEFKRIPNKNPANRILANGKDITDFIRTPEISMLASAVSAFPGVRSALLGLQRKLGCAANSILEGRDIGTVIFPDADVKFFMTATVDERAKRRLAELEAIGRDVPSFEEIRHQIEERDLGDSSRAIAPLKKAEDAIEVDTTDMTLDEVVQAMEILIRERIGKKR